jgi:hypothetical protein
MQLILDTPDTQTLPLYRHLQLRISESLAQAREVEPFWCSLGRLIDLVGGY